MKILVVNAGSSSLKCRYFIGGEDIASLLIERIGETASHAILTYGEHTLTHDAAIADHHEALIVMQHLFARSGILKTLDTLDAVGHRVVHGGEDFTLPTPITLKNIENLRTLIPLAPLHNPANIEAIEAFLVHTPKIPQIAVFDTAFHQTMPSYAYHYAIPLRLKEELHIRRYGFHGTSHRYVAKKAAAYLETSLEKLKLITLHLGNGASACAIQEGKSIDTSMGMTPLEGLMMGTRSGDIDPAIIPYLTRHGYSTQEVEHILNHDSGLKGIAGENDMREVLAKADRNDAHAQLALEIYAYRIKKYIGAYIAALGGVDAVVFTGGIGEHAARVRQMVCEGLSSMGILLDDKKNRSDSPRSIHQRESRVKLLVIPTNEELEIAMQCEDLLT